ncbi:MAG: D-amino acid dehydrogenase [Burkholderiales bacterium]
MKVLVLGAGVIGVATAHYLAEDGHEVTVLDRQPGAGLETSFGNAGNVCPSYATPWAAPGMRWKAVKWLLERDAPLAVRWRADASLAAWGGSWLVNCSRRRFERNKRRMQRLSHYSLACLQRLRESTGLHYEETTQGILQLLRAERELAAVVDHTRILEAAGIAHKLLDPKGCVEVEPGLAHARVPFAGGLHLPADETGDCQLFTHALAEHASRRGVRFRFQTAIEGIAVEGVRATGVATSRGLISADHYVVALGCGAVPLLAPLGIRLPIQPVKGYSLTLPIARPDLAPRASLMDEHTKIAITRLGNRVRAAGTAELGATTTDAPTERFGTLTRVLRELYPEAAELAQPQYWAGLRPMTPDGPPILGPTPIGNLLLNAGHGSQGWSMACGSGRVLADLVSGRRPEIDLEGLTLDRYA